MKKTGDAIQYISPKNLSGKCEENLWKTLWEKPKYFQYTRQNSLKSSEKNKKKHHNIQ